MTDSPPPQLLGLLREATRLPHERMHANPLLTHMLSDAATRADLALVLRRFQRFYGVMEPCREYSEFPRFEFEATPLTWLQRDLLKLDANAPQESTPAEQLRRRLGDGITPTTTTTTTIDTLESYLAYLYLKQGSSLGGQLISRRLHDNGVLLEGETCLFFNGHGQATGRHWQAFKVFLETFANDVDPDFLQARAAAHFAHLETCFSVAAGECIPAKR